ncbi:MAG: hypothetical protein U5K30_12865 [Acidimicrobiales bacterium]|nr:hypothetical protein [Acidimicrobiales bacterium]
MSDGREDAGSDGEQFTLLHQDSVIVSATPAEVWASVEADDQRALLGHLSNRFVDREILARTDEGYRCRTVSHARFGRRRSFESAVTIDEPRQSCEIQFGDRTDLRYTTTYEAVDDGAATMVTCEQAYRARRSSMEAGAAIAQLRKRAEGVVTARLAAIRHLLE